VRAPQSLGNDDVEARAFDLGAAEAEQLLGAAVPQAYQPFAVGEHDRVRRLVDDRGDEVGWLHAFLVS
jgi:hypothetical protein